MRRSKKTRINPKWQRAHAMYRFPATCSLRRGRCALARWRQDKRGAVWRGLHPHVSRLAQSVSIRARATRTKVASMRMLAPTVPRTVPETSDRPPHDGGAEQAFPRSADQFWRRASASRDSTRTSPHACQGIPANRSKRTHVPQVVRPGCGHQRIVRSSRRVRTMDPSRIGRGFHDGIGVRLAARRRIPAASSWSSTSSGPTGRRSGRITAMGAPRSVRITSRPCPHCLDCPRKPLIGFPQTHLHRALQIVTLLYRSPPTSR
jgi:hypothetical protein